MKTPISYYGGKQLMVKDILPLIPQHSLYCEPFFGGGAIFFAKPISKIEVINDLNGEVINFYRVLKTDYEALREEIECTLHSREMYRDAKVIYGAPHLFDEVKRAWAFWVLTNQGFSCKIGTWGYDKTSGSIEKKVMNAKQRLTVDYALRLDKVQIECNDALKVITSRDSESSFFYLDPPYFNSNMGHYGGYKLSDFQALLELIGDIKGKFLLSSYPSEILQEHTEKNHWQHFSIKKAKAVSKQATGEKTEVLTANYPMNR